MLGVSTLTLVGTGLRVTLNSIGPKTPRVFQLGGFAWRPDRVTSGECAKERVKTRSYFVPLIRSKYAV